MRIRFNKPARCQAAVRRLHRRGITIMGSFIFGLDAWGLVYTAAQGLPLLPAAAYTA